MVPPRGAEAEAECNVAARGSEARASPPALQAASGTVAPAGWSSRGVKQLCNCSCSHSLYLFLYL